MLLIIDGNNLAHRCKHTFSLSNHGVDVSVTYGVLRVLGSMLQKFKPTAVMVCWDGGVPEFRKKAVPEYKANRHANDDPDEYADFMRQMRELETYALPMMGVISVKKYGAEADDLMYHASRMVNKAIIVTTDKDLLQAVTDKVSVYNPVRDVVYTPILVEEMCGVPVEKFVDWRAIQGDSSDNIPGIYGIGEKTATKLFQEFDTLTSIVNAALGLHPTKKLTGKTADAFVSFGFKKIANNILITALYADRVGARLAVAEAVENRVAADIPGLKRYLLHNAFVSLVDGKFFSNVSSLGNAKLHTDMRMPVVISKQRRAYES